MDKVIAIGIIYHHDPAKPKVNISFTKERINIPFTNKE